MNAVFLQLRREGQPDSVGIVPPLHLPVIVISFLEEVNGHEQSIPYMYSSKTTSLQWRANIVCTLGRAG